MKVQMTKIEQEGLEERDVDFSYGLAIKKSLTSLLGFLICSAIAGLVFWLVFFLLSIWIGEGKSLVWGFAGLLAGAGLGGYVWFRLFIRFLNRISSFFVPSKEGGILQKFCKKCRRE